MLNVQTALVVLIVHFIADFILQSHWMAINKSKSWLALLAHGATYTAMLFACTAAGAWQYGLVNGLVHTAVDAVTSRITSALWKRGQVHNFFVVVGADQLIHTTFLLWTATLWLQ